MTAFAGRTGADGLAAMYSFVNVTRRTGGRLVLDRVSFQTSLGDAPLVVLGATPRGDVLEVLSGAAKPTSGEVLWKGTPLRQGRRDLRTPPSPSMLNPGRTVAQTLASARSKSGASASADLPEAQAEVFGLADKMQVTLRSLPPDARLRLGLAVLAVERPPIMLLDSLAASLTGGDRQMFLGELARLLEALRHPEGVLLYVADTAEEAEAAGGQLLVLGSGRRIQFGASREVFDQPQSLAVAEAVSAPRINTLALKVDVGGMRFPDGSLFAPGGAPFALATGEYRIAFRPRDVGFERSAEDALRFPSRVLGVRTESGRRYLELEFATARWLAPAPESDAPLQPGLVANLYLGRARLMVFDAGGVNVLHAADGMLFDSPREA